MVSDSGEGLRPPRLVKTIGHRRETFVRNNMKVQTVVFLSSVTNVSIHLDILVAVRGSI
jgi:hypothetical protein